MFINELSSQEKLALLRGGLGFRLGLDHDARCLGGSIAWRGPSEYPRAVFSCDGHSAVVARVAKAKGMPDNAARVAAINDERALLP